MSVECEYSGVTHLLEGFKLFSQVMIKAFDVAMCVRDILFSIWSLFNCH